LRNQAGCMLYWAEGSKEISSTIRFCNSDANMVCLSLGFLTEILQIEKKDIIVTFHCYIDCQTVAEIEHYWLN